MIRKRVATEETKINPRHSSPRSGNYVEIPLPQFSFKGVQRNNYKPMMIAALLIMSFLLGMLTTKISYLEGKDGRLPTLGKKNAPVTIVELSDFQCPFCKQFFDTTYAQLKTTYIDTGKAKLVFKHFPLSSIHPNAQKAAEASECANEQDKFWEMHDTLFKNQDTWAPKAAADAAKDFTAFAKQLGLNANQFSSCVATGKYAKVVSDDIAEGSTAGVTGTPAFLINGQLLVGAQPFSAFQAQIDPLLK